MTPEQFVYWLQGFMEVANPSSLTETQTQQIKDHLNLVFDKQTPDRTSQPNIDWPTVIPNPNQTHPYTGPDWTWRPNPYQITCETPTSTTTKIDQINLEVDASTKRLCGEIEESHNKLFCETHQVPPHMFGEGKQSRRQSNRENIKFC